MGRKGLTTGDRRWRIGALIVSSTALLLQPSCLPIADVFATEFVTQLVFRDHDTGAPLAGLRVTACAMNGASGISVWPGENGACDRDLAPTDSNGVTWAPGAYYPRNTGGGCNQSELMFEPVELVQWRLTIREDNTTSTLMIDNHPGNVATNGNIAVTVANPDGVMPNLPDPEITTDGLVRINGYIYDIRICDFESDTSPYLSSYPLPNYVGTVDVTQPIDGFDLDVAPYADYCGKSQTPGCPQLLQVGCTYHYGIDENTDKYLPVRPRPEGGLEPCAK